MKYNPNQQKHYDEMSRGEKRAYKRWLAKNELWDGAVVVENQIKSNALHMKNIKQAEAYTW